MIYLDTSCLVKLLREEADSDRVRNAVAAESLVFISSLAELETEVEFKGAVLGGRIRVSHWRQYQARLAAFRNIDPFQFKVVPATIFATALTQVRRPESVHCRTPDRLHLAAMLGMDLTRLMTLDRAQAKAAEALGFTVVYPR